MDRPVTGPTTTAAAAEEAARPTPTFLNTSGVHFSIKSVSSPTWCFVSALALPVCEEEEECNLERGLRSRDERNNEEEDVLNFNI